jgi:hypothetical protein
MLLAPEFLWRAHDLLQTQCPGQPWLLTASRVYLGVAWYHGGNMRDLRRHMGGWIGEARARDDHFAVAALAGLGSGSFRHAADDEPERGIEELTRAMANWPEAPPFTLNHVGAFLTQGMLLLCADQDGARLRQLLAVQRAQLDRAYAMSTPTLRLGLQWLRAAAALRSIDRFGVPSGHEALARARAETRVLRRVKVPLGRSTYCFLSGWIALLSGDREAARRAFEQAREVGEGADSINTTATRYSLGYVLGGAEGKRLRDEVQSQFEAFGFKNWQLGLQSRIPARLSLLGL